MRTPALLSGSENKSVTPFNRLFLDQQNAVRTFLGFWLPSLVFFIGLFLKVSPGETSFFVACALAPLAAGVGSYLMIFKLKEIRLSWAMGLGLILGYAGGALNSSVGLLKDGISLAGYTGRLQEDLSFALTIALWVSALLFVSGALIEKPLKLHFSRLLPTDMRLVYLSIAVILAAFASGRFGYMGAMYSDDFHVTPLADFAGMLCPTLPAVTIIMQPKNPRKWERILTYLLVLVEFVMILPTGRRVLIYSLVVAIFAVNLREFKLRPPLGKRFGLLICACLVVYPGMKFFYAIRVMTWRVGSAKEVSLIQLAKGAYDMLAEGDSTFDAAYDDNVKTRTSIITYLSDLLAAGPAYTPLHGEDILFCFKMAIPSALYPDKSDILKMEEEITNPAFGLPVEDDANSTLTTGIGDFGLFGCFLYPLLVPLIFNFAIRLIQRKTCEAAAVFALAASLITLLQAELSGTVFAGLLRDLILLTAGVMFVKKLPTLKPKVNSLWANRRAKAYLAPAYGQPDLPAPRL